MKTDGRTTFWGKQLPDDTDPIIKKLLGINMELHKTGLDQQSTDDHKLALSGADVVAVDELPDGRAELPTDEQPSNSGTDVCHPRRGPALHGGRAREQHYRCGGDHTNLGLRTTFGAPFARPSWGLET